jgi:DNA-binding CsgD family transcriptional regulator
MSAVAAWDAGSSLRYVLDRLTDGPHGQQTVSDAIMQSWRRSADAGLIPFEIRAPYDPDVDADGRLRWAAAPGMAAVRDDLAGVGVALLLADGRGHVIERWAWPGTAAVMDRVGAAAGFVCDEALVGTNSIGAAARLGGPAVVLGWEHFADGLTGVSCASRAVSDPLTGQLLGVVNATCPASEYSAVLPALVGRMVHEVRQRLLDDERGARATALYAAFVRARRRARGPVAVVDRRSMFVNRAGATILQRADRDALWSWAEPLLGTVSHRTVSTVVVASGAHGARCAAVYDGNTVVGAIIWLDEGPSPGSVRDPLGDAAARWATLTPSERGVAEHVANGLTNRETGSALFISAHTVDYHLRQIFRKLDLRSRVELARLVAEANHRTAT